MWCFFNILVVLVENLYTVVFLHSLLVFVVNSVLPMLLVTIAFSLSCNCCRNFIFVGIRAAPPPLCELPYSLCFSKPKGPRFCPAYAPLVGTDTPRWESLDWDKKAPSYILLFVGLLRKEMIKT